MVEAGPNSDVGQIDAAAIMAIRGLAALAEAAAHEGQEKPMEKVVDQLFRQCPSTLSVRCFHCVLCNVDQVYWLKLGRVSRRLQMPPCIGFQGLGAGN